MGWVGDGSMSSPPKIEYLPATENDDGIMGVDISNLSSSENPDIVSASVNCVARYYRSKNKELRVKVPREYFTFIAPLWQMGFNIIEHAESTYTVLREDKSLQSASGVTLMQRGSIASSSNPCNLICSQTPSETACASDWKWVSVKSGDTRVEQDHEFQHSSQAFPSGSVGMGNDNKVAGLQDFFAGPEIPVQTKKRPRSANKAKHPSTRTRGPDFKDEEKGLLLRFTLEFLQDPANKRQSHTWLTPVSKEMTKNGYDRDPAAWRGLWDTLKKNCDAMRRRFPQGTGYWDLTEVEKSAIKQIDKHFPLTFEPEWVVAMENIWKLKPRRAAKKETRRDGKEGVFSQLLASTITEPGSAYFASAGSSGANNQASVQHPRQASAQGSDEDQNPQRPEAPPSCNQDLSFLHSLREKDNQEMFHTMEEQLVALKKLMKSSSPDSLGFVDYAGCSDLAGCNELENEE